MYCTNCGNLLNENENFCSKCGTPVKKEENKVDTFNFNPNNNQELNSNQNVQNNNINLESNSVNLQNNSNNNLNNNSQNINGAPIQSSINQNVIRQNTPNIPKKKKSNGAFIVLLIIFILIIIGLLSFIGLNLYKKYVVNSNTSSTNSNSNSTVVTNTDNNSNNKVVFYGYEFVVPDNLNYKVVDDIPAFGNSNEVIAIGGITDEYTYSEFTNEINNNIDDLKQLISEEDEGVKYISNSEKVYNNRKVAIYKFNYSKENNNLDIYIAITTLDDDSVILSMISVKSATYEDDAFNNFSLIAASGKISEAKSFAENSKNIMDKFEVLPNINNASF